METLARWGSRGQEETENVEVLGHAANPKVMSANTNMENREGKESSRVRKQAQFVRRLYYIVCSVCIL